MTAKEAEDRGREHFRAGKLISSGLGFHSAILMIDRAMRGQPDGMRVAWFRGFVRASFGL